jgi:hypothetical protein
MTSVEWRGLEELKAALRQLPTELTGEASRIVEGTANAAIVDMRAEYPPGELRDGLYQSTQSTGPYGVGIVIRNRSGWAWHWDYGTQMRHWVNGKSTGRLWPPHHTFGRTMAQSRRRMYAQLQQLLERHGLRVSGEP